MSDSKTRIKGLTGEENEAFGRLLGAKCQSLASAKVQLLLTQGSEHYQWLAEDDGLVSLIKDTTKRVLIFRLFDLRRQALTWEMDLRCLAKLDSPPFRGFLSFRAERSHVGLLFEVEEEALVFFKVVENIMVGDNRKLGFTKSIEPDLDLTNRRHSVAVPISNTIAETKSSKNSNGNVAKSLFFKIKKGKFAKKEVEKVVEVQKMSEIDMEDEDTRHFMDRFSSSGLVNKSQQPVPELEANPLFVDLKDVPASEPVTRKQFQKKTPPLPTLIQAPIFNKVPPPTNRVPPPPPAKKKPFLPVSNTRNQAPVPAPRKMDWEREKSVDFMDTDGELQFTLPEGDFIREDEISAIDGVIEDSEA